MEPRLMSIGGNEMSEEIAIEPPPKKLRTDNGDSENIVPNVKLEKEREVVEDVDMTSDKDLTVNDDKYNNFVTPEELEKLKEFQVLDEVRSNDDDSNDEESDSSDGKSEGLPEDEIEKMLDEDLPEDFKGAPKPKEKPFITRQKIVLEEAGINHFEVLPLDWMMVRHYSGMPIYMHRNSRVCTLSKPYFLGKGNTRRHDIPISAIPCLAYRKALEEKEKQNEIDRQIQEQIKNGTWKQNIEFNDKTQNGNEKTQSDEITHKSKDGSKKSDKVIEITDNSDSIVDEIKKIPSKCPFNHVAIEETQNNDISRTNETNELTSSQPIENDHPAESNVESSKTTNSDQSKLDSKMNDIAIEVDQSLNSEPNEIATEVDQLEMDSQINVVAEDGQLKLDTNEVATENGQSKLNSDINEVATEDDQSKLNSDNTQKELPLNRQPVVLPGGIVMPPPRVETVSASWKTQHLTHEQVNDYCKNLFKFKTVNIMHFKRWADRRKYTKARKTLQYPTLPEGTKLITIPAQPAGGPDNGGKATKRDWVMNMNGRSYLSVFHEYVRRALQMQPVYEFKQLENASTPYQATVYIGGMQYGLGRGSSKRQAKALAARASIRILIPEMRADLDAPARTDLSEPDFSFFEYVGIEDPRITEFCAATCEPSPHAILRTCLLRNFGAGDRHIHTEMKKLEYQKIELTMKVGKHTATVVCKNKKTAKQRASQAILQSLHPHVRSWGSLLRLYGSRSVKSCKEKKIEEQQITLLQDAARHNEPNYAVLEKLRNEMRKLRERDEAVVPIGTLLMKDDLPTHSGSNLNNVDL